VKHTCPGRNNSTAPLPSYATGARTRRVGARELRRLVSARPHAGFFLTMMPWRAKKRDNALRLPGIRRFLAGAPAGQASSGTLGATTWNPRYATSVAACHHRRERCRRRGHCRVRLDRGRVQFVYRRCARRASHRFSHSSAPHLATHFCGRAKLSANSMTNSAHATDDPHYIERLHPTTPVAENHYCGRRR
jgi:hypothetical protein